MSDKAEVQEWTTIITSKKKRFHLGLNDLYDYRDLMYLFFKRDFTALYKQTILGPAWYVIQPLFTTIVYAFIFGNLAGLGTDGIPSYLFYLSGVLLWRYFADSLNKSSNTFITNAGLFGKVYFPRLTAPISAIGANLIALVIQLLMFIILYVYYLLNGMPIDFHWSMILFPLVIFQITLLGIGIGLIVTSMTTKYRDLRYLITFALQLWMYATPVAYPLSELIVKVPESIYWIFWINPIAFPIELFRFMLFQSNTLDWNQGFFSIGLTILFFILGVTNFNRVERDFMDRI